MLLEFEGRPNSVFPAWAYAPDLRDPMSHLPIGVGEAALPPRELTEDECVAVERHARQLAELDAAKFALAARKVMSALRDRRSAEDRLLDAFTAWEALVSGNTETTFRVCAGIAWLTSETPEARREAFKDAKRHYDVRSKVVHGSRVSDDQMQRTARDATLLAVRAIRGLIQRYPALAGRSASERAVALLLGLSELRIPGQGATLDDDHGE
jgi:hypothetical protein